MFKERIQVVDFSSDAYQVLKANTEQTLKVKFERETKMAISYFIGLIMIRVKMEIVLEHEMS